MWGLWNFVWGNGGCEAWDCCHHESGLAEGCAGEQGLDVGGLVLIAKVILNACVLEFPVNQPINSFF